MNHIYYKEWIKTRWYLLLALVITLCFSGYLILRLDRAIELKGIAHVWEVMLSRDAIFIDPIKYVPLLTGILLAIVQFLPEMYHKCLKLTLHLPCSHLRLTNSMLGYGVAALLVCFGLNLLALYLYLQHGFAPELVSRILMTSLPWFLAGICAYLMVAWVVLEPTWKMRIVNLVISALALKIFYISGEPEAYNGFLVQLIVFTALTVTLSWNSIHRFKCGKQD